MYRNICIFFFHDLQHAISSLYFLYPRPNVSTFPNTVNILASEVGVVYLGSFDPGLILELL